ncbi:hypothetical protein [Desulfovibrio sp. Huiquan2017]|uniref:hypothetical protein n=1 Tax=Desulfovibrio sp. Huiquan2017 TaxID=2816861 RepID=UPI001A9193F4|nr:hypothetical protein [Desulfovibrio sp. Huiquan2017]
MHTKKTEAKSAETHLVFTTNGGAIDGCAGAFDDKAAADHVATELRRLGHDCIVETRERNIVIVRVSGDDVAPVRTISEADMIDLGNGQVIDKGHTVEEAMTRARAVHHPVPTTLTSHHEIKVSTDDSGRTVVEFTGSAAQLIAENARECTLDTASKIKDGNGKPTSKFRSNLAGQIGEAAGQIYLHGPVAGMARYSTERQVRNADKYRGDGGVDALIGSMRIDFKTTLRFARHAAPEKFRLAVRPHERHHETTYVMVLADKIGYDHFMVTIVGICHESDLPDTAETAGTFRGAYTVPVPRLSAPSNLLEATA